MIVALLVAAWTVFCAFVCAAILVGQAGRWDDDLLGLGFALGFYLAGLAIAVAAWEDYKRG